MMNDPKRLDSAAGVPLERHLARARHLQVETLRDGIKALYFNILTKIKPTRSNAVPTLDDDDFVCGHI